MSFSSVPLIPHAVPAIGERWWGGKEEQVFTARSATSGGWVQNRKVKARAQASPAPGPWAGTVFPGEAGTWAASHTPAGGTELPSSWGSSPLSSRLRGDRGAAAGRDARRSPGGWGRAGISVGTGKGRGRPPSGGPSVSAFKVLRVLHHPLARNSLGSSDMQVTHFPSIRDET